MSFTRTAAAEALSRLMLSKSENVSTIHALCFRLARVHHNSVVDRAKLREFVDSFGIPISGGGPDEELEEGDHYLQVISLAENRMIGHEEAYHSGERPGSFDDFMAFYKAYTAWKDGRYYVDFNDMLKRVLQKPVAYHASHIIIDEAQDLSKLQWAVIDKLVEAAEPAEVHIAGDDDQTIHSYAGAEAHGMEAFEDKYTAERSVLPHSWRLPSTVHEVAGEIIGKVSKRTPKEFTHRGAEGEVRRFGDIFDIEVEHGDDVLILGRTHSMLREIEVELRDRALPYRKLTGMPSPLDNRYGRAIAAWLKGARGEKQSFYDVQAIQRCLPAGKNRNLVDAGEASVYKQPWQFVFQVPSMLFDYYHNVNFNDTPTIRLSTIHGAKGREAQHVVLVTNVTDHMSEVSMRNLDEELRVWYTGVTRAKTRLDIVSDGSNPLQI